MFRSLIIILIIILSNNEIFGQVPKLIPYLNNGKWGYISSIDKSIKIKAQYDSVSFFKNNKAIVAKAKKNKKLDRSPLDKKFKKYDFAVIDTSNNYLISSKYQYVKHLEGSDNYIIKKKGYFNIINNEDKVIFPAKNQAIFSIFPISSKNDTLQFRSKKGNGIVLSSGKILIKDEHVSLSNNNVLGFYYMKDIHNYGYLNNDGTIRLSSKKINKGELNIGLSYPTIEIDGQSYLINWEQEIISKGYKDIQPFKGDIAKVINNMGQFNFINSKGRELFKRYFKSSATTTFQNRIIIIEEGKKKWIFDLKKERLIPITYDDIEMLNLNSPYIAAKKEDKWGIVNQENQEVIPFRYKKIYFITEGFIQFKTFEGYWGVLDIKNDKVIITAKYNQIKGVSIGESYVLVVELDKKEAVFNLDGKLILPFGNYNLYGEPEQNLFFVLDKIKDIAYYMDIKGNKYIP